MENLFRKKFEESTGGEESMEEGQMNAQSRQIAAKINKEIKLIVTGKFDRLKGKTLGDGLRVYRNLQSKPGPYDKDNTYTQHGEGKEFLDLWEKMATEKMLEIENERVQDFIAMRPWGETKADIDKKVGHSGHSKKPHSKKPEVTMGRSR